MGNIMFDNLPTSQLVALRSFAWAYGRGWKSALHALWRDCKATPELQALRNSRGPSWLERVSIQEINSECNARIAAREAEKHAAWNKESN